MKKKILIADDDASVRKALGKVLEDEGYEIVLAADSREVLEEFESGSFDLVLLDIGLPTRTGWDRFDCVTRRAPDLPVIVLIGRANQYDMEVAAGIGALMEKPLDVCKFLQTAKELLAESQESRLRRLRSFNPGNRFSSQSADHQQSSQKV